MNEWIDLFLRAVLPIMFGAIVTLIAAQRSDKVIPRLEIAEKRADEAIRDTESETADLLKTGDDYSKYLIDLSRWPLKGRSSKELIETRSELLSKEPGKTRWKQIKEGFTFQNQARLRALVRQWYALYLARQRIMSKRKARLRTLAIRAGRTGDSWLGIVSLWVILGICLFYYLLPSIVGLSQLYGGDWVTPLHFGEGSIPVTQGVALGATVIALLFAGVGALFGLLSDKVELWKGWRLLAAFPLVAAGAFGGIVAGGISLSIGVLLTYA